MRNFAFGFFAVLAISSVAAMLGHMYCREFCIATKPVLWPVVYMVLTLGKTVYLTNKKDRKNEEGK